MHSDHEVAVGGYTLAQGNIAVAFDVIAQPMPAYRSKFQIRFSYFKNAMNKLSIRFLDVAVRYFIHSYGENIEKLCACTKFYDAHRLWFNVSYRVSIS